MWRIRGSSAGGRDKKKAEPRGERAGSKQSQPHGPDVGKRFGLGLEDSTWGTGADVGEEFGADGYLTNRCVQHLTVM